METVSSVVALLAAVALGLTTGALLAEGAILVPFWRSLPSENFLSWYQLHAALLQQFFGPLEVAAAILTAVAAALSRVSADRRNLFPVMATLFAVAVLAVFPIYFQRVNTSFAAGTIAADRVAEELRRWSSWHWFRTVMAMAAFVFSLAALIGRRCGVCQ